MREAHVPTQQPEAQENPRIPAPDADARRSRGAPGAARPRPQASLRLIWRIRDRATFDALARVPPIRRGALWLRCARVPGGEVAPRVAYAVGRSTGNAVERNRARRRLREAVRAAATDLEPGCAYLFGANRAVVTMPYPELAATVEHLLRSARSPDRPDPR
jgi:ribonuclease P protein component